MGVVFGNRSVECYARKLGVLGETIDEKILQGLRSRLSNLLVIDGKEVFELFAAQGRDSNALFADSNTFPYLLRVDRSDPNNPHSRFRIVAVLKSPVLKSPTHSKGAGRH